MFDFSITRVLLSLIFLLYLQHSYGKRYEERGKEVIEKVNDAKATWEAQITPDFVGKEEHVMANFLGVKPDFHKQKPHKDFGKRPNRMQRVGAQSVSSATVMTDRCVYCVYTGQNRYFSFIHLTTCVYETGGCEAGYPKDAMIYYKDSGVATGGDLTIFDQPYGSLKYPKYLDMTSECPVRCDDGSPLDSTKGRCQTPEWREITEANVTEIMQEIYTYGSVVAIYEVFQDFGYMGKGAYQHVFGNSSGWHAVPIIGWGVTAAGTLYWQCSNQWGPNWGDKGYFKILRGSDHCSIERWITVVYPTEAYDQIRCAVFG